MCQQWFLLLLYPFFFFSLFMDKWSLRGSRRQSCWRGCNDEEEDVTVHRKLIQEKCCGGNRWKSHLLVMGSTFKDESFNKRYTVHFGNYEVEK